MSEINFNYLKSKFQKKEVQEYTNSVDENPVVCICVQTYQHVNYIKQCLDGILIQETTFPFEILLGEDASTDGTREICLEYAKKYPDKIRLFLHHRENNIKINGKPTGRFNFLYNLFSARGKYIAFCEGDDYWTDPLKLQKQVDFLEENEDYSICWTKYLEKNELEKKNKLENPGWLLKIEKDKNIEVSLHSLFSPYSTYTLTTMFRKHTLDTKLFSSLRYGKDNSLYAICLSEGRGIVLDFFSGVYRIHAGGIYSSSDSFKKNFGSYLNLKEIVRKIPRCNNSNIKSIRNYHLGKAIETSPKGLSLIFFRLVIDSISYLGIAKASKLLNK